MINTSIGLVGVALQSDKATAATEPTFIHGLTGGGLIKPERTVDTKSVACGMRANTSSSSYVSEVDIAVDFETMAYADVLGLYLYATLGNVVSTSASTDGYYTHTFTLGSSIPYETFWSIVGDTSLDNMLTAVGCKMDTLSLSYEGNDPLDIGVTAAGIDATLFNAWSGSTEPSCFDGYFAPTNGTFLISTNSQTPEDVTITSGSFELSNSLTAYRGAGQVTPSEIAEGKLTTTASVTTQPDDYTIIRELLTGSDSGTSITSEIVYGSTSWTFTHTQDSNCTLAVEISNVPWTCDMPEVDPDGGAAEVEFTADNVGIASKDGSPVTVTLTNKVESYA